MNIVQRAAAAKFEPQRQSQSKFEASREKDCAEVVRKQKPRNTD